MTSTSGAIRRKTRAKAPLLTVARVAATPTRRFFVRAAARWTAGSTTPVMGMSLSSCKVSRQLLLTVPQAMTMALGPKVRRNRVSSRAYLRIVSRLRLP